MAACETTACPLCATIACDRLVTATDPLAESQTRYNVVRCRECGLAYTSPRPTTDAIARCYPSDYLPHQQRPTTRHHPFLPLLARPTGPLLDFGCGAGGLLERLHRLGWQVTGLDSSPRMARQVRDRLGLTVLAGTLPHPELTPGSFTVITMAEALEHVHEPLTVLRAARALLTPDGRLLLSVPNLDSLAAQWFGADWIGLDLPRHLTHFTPATLSLMLERAGFRVERLEPLHHHSWLRRSAARTRAGRARLLRYRALASLAGWYSRLRGRCNGILAVAVPACSEPTPSPHANEKGSRATSQRQSARQAVRVE